MKPEWQVLLLVLLLLLYILFLPLVVLFCWDGFRAWKRHGILLLYGMRKGLPALLNLDTFRATFWTSCPDFLEGSKT